MHNLTGSGTAAARITIASYPGETATVVGWVRLQGSYTTISHLRIDGSNTFYSQRRAGTHCPAPVSQGLAIAGHDDVMEYDNYFQSIASLRGNGIGIGWWGSVDNTIIRFNRIHDVGGCDFYDHLIYLAAGNHAQIYGNWLWNDPHGWGVKLDPGPTNARVWDNVVDAAASGFDFANSSGNQPTAGNQVFDNIVMNSTGLVNPDIHWSHPGVLAGFYNLLPSSTGNQVYGNDSYNNPGGLSEYGTAPGQLSIFNNSEAAPPFVNAANHDYRLLPLIGNRTTAALAPG